MAFRKGKRHRRDWRRLWRYCRCGHRWRCPDSATLVPTPYQPFVRPMTEEEYRAGLRASSPVPEVVRYEPIGPPPAGARTGTDR
ncbi:hypothetical protein ACN27G_03790 [Plantactinospora sp. WMMB334]|uniref:hypothetical protein n=1 Tax=Plantactinospora sp. WMMB334 TaxID=3404119 RepID=UPI003B95C2BB